MSAVGTACWLQLMPVHRRSRVSSLIVGMLAKRLLSSRTREG
jgi:hypothetical protein